MTVERGKPSIDSLRKESTVNDKLADKIFTASSQLTDEIPLIELRIRPPWRKRFSVKSDQGKYAINPPREWEVFYNKLDKNERSVLSRALSSVIQVGYETLGDLRMTNIEDILQKTAGDRMSIGEITAAFLKRAF